jgi:hypothetical protein
MPMIIHNGDPLEFEREHANVRGMAAPSAKRIHGLP